MLRCKITNTEFEPTDVAGLKRLQHTSHMFVSYRASGNALAQLAEGTSHSFKIQKPLSAACFKETLHNPPPGMQED